VIELDVEEIGPSLRYATAKVSKQNGRGSKARAGSGARGGSGGGAADDPLGGAPRLRDRSPGATTRHRFSD
jgi:single-strand DNA-binding protein